MPPERSDPSLLIIQYLKFVVVFLPVYYAVLVLGAWLLRIHFLNSLSILGPAGPEFCMTYLIGIQLIGLGFGWIGYGAAAVHRETQMRFWGLVMEFLRRGPFQRTGKPSWQTAISLFSSFFLLGHFVSACLLLILLKSGVDEQVFQTWTESFGIIRGFVLLFFTPFIPAIVVARVLLPDMTKAEFYWALHKRG